MASVLLFLHFSPLRPCWSHGESCNGIPAQADGQWGSCQAPWTGRTRAAQHQCQLRGPRSVPAFQSLWLMLAHKGKLQRHTCSSRWASGVLSSPLDWPYASSTAPVSAARSPFRSSVPVPVAHACTQGEAAETYLLKQMGIGGPVKPPWTGRTRAAQHQCQLRGPRSVPAFQSLWLMLAHKGKLQRHTCSTKQVGARDPIQPLDWP